MVSAYFTFKFDMSLQIGMFTFIVKCFRAIELKDIGFIPAHDNRGYMQEPPFI